MRNPNPPGNYPHSEKVYPINLLDLMNFCDSGPIGSSPFGVWIKHQDTGELIYARIFDVELLKEIPFFNTDPLVTKRSDIVEGEQSSFVRNISHTDKLILVLNFLIKWAYEVYSLDSNTRNYKKFLEEYVTYKEEPQDDVDYYHIEMIKEKLPEVDNIDDCLNLFNSADVFPFKDDRVLLHSKKFYGAIEYMLMTHTRLMDLSRKTKKSRHIPGYYKSAYDFIQQPKTVVYIGASDVRRTVADPNTPYLIQDKLEERDIVGDEPIVYTKNNVLYLIQKTVLGTLRAACYVCKRWEDEEINVGYHQSKHMEIIDKTVIIYKIIDETLTAVQIVRPRGTSGTEKEFETIEEIEDLAEEEFYEVLLLFDNKYAALLRL